jgi:Protein of unknown function (DUF998)
MNLNKGINKITRTLLKCGPFGCILFIGMFLIQGQLRVGYSAEKFPISSLSIGEFGWIQIINFLTAGAFIFLSAVGFRKATSLMKGSLWTARLIGAVGIGLFGAGLFSSDPVYGYPVTSQLALAQFTIHGHLHDLFSIFVFICLPILCFRMKNIFKAANKRQWATYSTLSGIVFLVFFVLAGIGFKQMPGFVDFAGVLQRLCIIVGFGWLTALFLFILKESKQGQR